MNVKQIDLSGKIRKPFRPKQPERTRFIKTPLHIDEDTDNKLTKMAKKYSISKQELARQMVRYCINIDAEKGE